MRDPNRIPVIIAKVQEQWIENPDLRLMQLLVNLIAPETPCPELYYLEDDEIMKRLKGGIPAG